MTDIIFFKRALLVKHNCGINLLIAISRETNKHTFQKSWTIPLFCMLMIGWGGITLLLFVLNMLLMSLLCFMCWQTWRPSVVGEIFHQGRSRRDFIRKIKQNRPNIELRWMVAKAKQGQRKHKSHVGGEWRSNAIHMHQAQALSLLTYRQRSPAFPQGWPLLWTPAPLALAGSPTSVPGSVWASHKSGFCPHRTHRLPLHIKNEILLSHSSLW